MKLVSYFLVDREHQNPSAIESNIDELHLWLIGSISLGSWELLIKAKNGDITLSDVELPLNFYLDSTDEYSGYKLYRTVGTNVLFFDFDILPKTGTRLDVFIKFVE